VKVRYFVIGFVVLLLVCSGVGWFVLTRPGPKPPPIAIIPNCVAQTANGTTSLDPTQIANAATIAAVGIRRGMPDQAIVIALAVAMQESHLENLTGGDRDSIGLFQQRPSQGWGTAENLANPRYAADAFYTSLNKVKGWQSMRVTEAAQRVQRSAYPEAYAQWETHAMILGQALVGSVPSALSCSGLNPPEIRGAAAVTALDADLRQDWGDHIGALANPTTIGLTVAASDARSGWQYAHWLVAHSDERGIARVRFGDQEWTADRGTWTRVDAPVDHVLAEVYRS
jgi:hypothetical protein